MRILNREAVTKLMLSDMELILTCTNDDVLKYCDHNGWDIYDFIEKLDE